jgi:hypothetical protein
MRMFDDAGRRVWTSSLPNVDAVAYDTRSAHSITLFKRAGGYQRVQRVIELSSDAAIVELVSLGSHSSTWGNPGPIEWRVIDLHTGAQVGKTAGTRELIAARNGNGVFVDYLARTVTVAPLERRFAK